MNKPKILVADDVPLNFIAIEDVLEQAGCEPVLAMDGNQAVETFLSINCSLILMDLRMPVMNGLDAVRRIRQHEQSLSATPVSRIPIVMLSASLDDQRAAQEAGCDDYLVKPLCRKVLSDVLNRHLLHLSHQVFD